MTKSLHCGLGTLLLIAVAGGAQAADPQAGKAQASQCAPCHGAQGKSSSPQIPHLAGQQEQYLISALKAYKRGDRTDGMMSPVAKGLSEEDIQNLAAYYSGLDP